MITFPQEYVATRYPGYFWNTNDNRLYSIKVTGALKPLIKSKPNKWNGFSDGYCVSVRGKKRYMSNEYLKKLAPKQTIFPVWTQLELV